MTNEKQDRLRKLMRMIMHTKRRGGNYKRLEEHARKLRRTLHRRLN